MKHPTRGRPVSTIRPRVETFPVLDINWLRRCQGAACITWGRRLALRYAFELGGVRFWFGAGPSTFIETAHSDLGNGGWCPYLVCPRCDRWRRKLLLVDATRPICRGCLGAVYDSQYEGALITASKLRWKLREKLAHRDGLARGTLDDLGPRPRHMKRQSWTKVEARDAQLAERWQSGIARKYGAIR